MMKARIPGAALTAAILMLAAADAFAYRMIQNTGVGRFSSGSLVTCNHSGGFVHWTTCNIPWRLNTSLQGSGKTAAVQAALAAWTNVSSACHNLTYAGTTTAGFTTDGINTLRWGTGSGCTGSCLALTALVLQSGQVIVETDVTFNNSVTWTTTGSNYDTQAVTTHELGHALGIHHSNLSSSPTPTMYAYYFGSGGRSLESDDRSALQCAQNRYPPAGARFEAEPAAHEVAGAARPVTLSARPRAGGAILRYALPAAGEVRLDVFDVAGRRVATLVAGWREAGDHEIAWDGAGPFGRVASGMYFARLGAPQGAARATVILAE